MDDSLSGGRHVSLLSNYGAMEPLDWCVECAACEVQRMEYCHPHDVLGASESMVLELSEEAGVEEWDWGCFEDLRGQGCRGKGALGLCG